MTSRYYEEITVFFLLFFFVCFFMISFYLPMAELTLAVLGWIKGGAAWQVGYHLSVQSFQDPLVTWSTTRTLSVTINLSSGSSKGRWGWFCDGPCGSGGPRSCACSAWCEMDRGASLAILLCVPVCQQSTASGEPDGHIHGMVSLCWKAEPRTERQLSQRWNLKT